VTGGKKPRNRFDLTQEDRALWEKVKQTAKPLRAPASRTRKPEAATGAAPADSAADPTRKAAAEAKPARQNPQIPKAPGPAKAAAKPGIRAPVLNPLDRRTVQRIARGATTIDGRIDLHGLTQRDAHGRLLQFLSASQARGDKVVLVITGKGSRQPGEPDSYREIGVLRRAVPLWLQEPGFRTLVVGYERAHKSHGGDGALYIRLRRRNVDGFR